MREQYRKLLGGRAATILGGLVLANIAIWTWAWGAFAIRPELFGTAVLAYVLGLRHAFDPDHIAAIDNVVRKLMQEGRSSHLVGCYFALGHSSIVIIASLVIAGSALSFDLHELSEINLIRTVASALFLLVIAAINVVILRSTWQSFVQIKAGGTLTSDSESVLESNSALARLFRPLFRMVSKSWHMFPVGFAFGIGFDTATEIGLFGISATQAVQGVSLWMVLLFPLLFAAGMTLMDTIDSVLMTNAYGWAFVNPIRKVWYNLTLTMASVVAAIFIGSLEVLGLLREKLGWDSGLWKVVHELNDNLENLGFWIVGIFVASWIVSVILYRAGRYDELKQGALPDATSG